VCLVVYHLYHSLTLTNEPKPLIVSDGDNMVIGTKFSVERRVEGLKENNRICNAKGNQLVQGNSGLSTVKYCPIVLVPDVSLPS